MRTTSSQTTDIRFLSAQITNPQRSSLLTTATSSTWRVRSLTVNYYLPTQPQLSHCRQLTCASSIHRQMLLRVPSHVPQEQCARRAPSLRAEHGLNRRSNPRHQLSIPSSALNRDHKPLNRRPHRRSHRQHQQRQRHLFRQARSLQPKSPRPKQAHRDRNALTPQHQAAQALDRRRFQARHLNHASLDRCRALFPRPHREHLSRRQDSRPRFP